MLYCIIILGKCYGKNQFLCLLRCIRAGCNIIGFVVQLPYGESRIYFLENAVWRKTTPWRLYCNREVCKYISQSSRILSVTTMKGFKNGKFDDTFRDRKGLQSRRRTDPWGGFGTSTSPVLTSTILCIWCEATPISYPSLPLCWRRTERSWATSCTRRRGLRTRKASRVPIPISLKIILSYQFLFEAYPQK